ncbi:MAG: type II toxin-antitoxin system RelE/ParE family toxin [Rhizobiales bacterium]|nr:type II toxin-antitoxin system RelE/ParE family toxin [Hyphomicrobiales bacterium]
MIIVWLPVARDNLNAAIEWIADDSPSAALTQLDEIERQVELLASFPDMGRAGRVDGTRELVIARTPFILIYRVRPKESLVEILRLLHGAQNWP